MDKILIGVLIAISFVYSNPLDISRLLITNKEFIPQLKEELIEFCGVEMEAIRQAETEIYSQKFICKSGDTLEVIGNSMRLNISGETWFNHSVNKGMQIGNCSVLYNRLIDASTNCLNKHFAKSSTSFTDIKPTKKKNGFLNFETKYSIIRVFYSIKIEYIEIFLFTEED